MCVFVCVREREVFLYFSLALVLMNVTDYGRLSRLKKGNKLFSFQFSCSLILPEDSLIWCFDNGDNILVQNLKSVPLIWDYLAAQTIPVISHNWSVGTLLRPRPPGFHSRTKVATFALQWPFHSQMDLNNVNTMPLSHVCYSTCVFCLPSFAFVSIVCLCLSVPFCVLVHLCGL